MWAVCAQVSSCFEGGVTTFDKGSKHLSPHTRDFGKCLMRAALRVGEYPKVDRSFHSLSTEFPACRPSCPQSYPQGGLWDSNTNYMLVITTEKTKRPSAGTRRPLLIHPLATTNGGTMPESTDGKTRAAVTHLNLLRTNPGNAAYFVRLAYIYGLTIPRISEESGLPIESVQRMVLGGDQR